VDAGAPTLERRLANFRASLRTSAGGLGETGNTDAVRTARAIDNGERTERLAAALDAEAIRSSSGVILRIESPRRRIPIDRPRLARLPGQPPAETVLVCLDTETTGLATAAGTLAFLVGLGWWEGDWFRQVQLVLPDHADEPAMLAALADLLPADAWLVTYNGRGFDWPLLVTRYRMIGRPAPPMAGHLDLLPLVRRIFRHRLADARLRTVELSLLGVRRIGDVEGWEIPGRYFDVLRGGSPTALVDVVRHNDEDVRSLARLLVEFERGFGDDDARRRADPGDLAGLGRAFARERRLDEALDCLELAVCRVDLATPEPGPPRDVPWWSPARAADFGGPAPRPRPLTSPQPIVARWTEERLLVERAHLLRRLGRVRDAADAWSALATGQSRLAACAAVELAKLSEHHLADLPGAIAAVDRGWRILDRRRRLGRPEAALAADLVRRSLRLRRRQARAAAARRRGIPSAVGQERTSGFGIRASETA
jgi:uncharacterized protein YprB with RNaseH-like and TPR domain